MNHFRIIGGLDNRKEGELPIDATVWVAINDCIHAGPRLKDIVISKKMASDIEIDFVFDQLAKQLESARKFAKKQLKIGIEKLGDRLP
jgi:hypothetical protein